MTTTEKLKGLCGTYRPTVVCHCWEGLRGGHQFSVTVTSPASGQSGLQAPKQALWRRDTDAGRLKPGMWEQGGVGRVCCCRQEGTQDGLPYHNVAKPRGVTFPWVKNEPQEGAGVKSLGCPLSKTAPVVRSYVDSWKWDLREGGEFAKKHTWASICWSTNPESTSGFFFIFHSSLFRNFIFLLRFQSIRPTIRI